MKTEILEQLAEKWEHKGRDGQTEAIADDDASRMAEARNGGFATACNECAKELRELIKLLSY